MMANFEESLKVRLFKSEESLKESKKKIAQLKLSHKAKLLIIDKQ